MKHKILKTRLSILLAVLFSIFSITPTVCAEETSKSEFGDILYADQGVTVLYGNPYENEEATKLAETRAARSLRHDYIWIDAYTATYKTVSIPATTDNPITYFTIKQESTSAVERSYVTVFRPDNSTCLMVNLEGQTTIEAADKVVSTKVLQYEFNNKYAWTSGSLKLGWDVETSDSGARMNILVW